MAAWDNRKMDKDCPCEKDCPERSSTCHSTCERYLKYRERKIAECEERAKTANLEGCVTAGSKRIKRDAIMKQKRGY